MKNAANRSSAPLADGIRVAEFRELALIETAFVASRPEQKAKAFAQSMSSSGQRIGSRAVRDATRRAHRLRKKMIRLFRVLAGPLTFYRWQILLLEPRIFSAQILLRGGGGLSGPYQWRRLSELRDLVRNVRFQAALELGPGASTLLFLKYCESVVSIEESDDWAAHYVHSLSRSRWTRSLSGKIREILLVVPRVEGNDAKGERVCRYELPASVSAKVFDLVYVDGPTNTAQLRGTGRIRDLHGTLPNVDALASLENLPSTIVVDQRRATVAYLAEHLPSDFAVFSDVTRNFSKRSFNHRVFTRPSHVPEVGETMRRMARVPRQLR